MSDGKKVKVIRVDKLIVYANDVDIIDRHKKEDFYDYHQEDRHEGDFHDHQEVDRHDDEFHDGKREDHERHDPWGFFWGRRETERMDDD